MANRFGGEPGVGADGSNRPCTGTARRTKAAPKVVRR